MRQISYDGSFAGFLSAVADIYTYRIADPGFKGSTGSLFNETYISVTSEENVKRIWKSVIARSSPDAGRKLHSAFLSELDGIEDLLYQYIKYQFAAKANIEKDYSHPAVLQISQTAKKVHREKHRMEAFVRFKLTGDQLYYAVVEPDFNVLPLISKHFEKRYADQRWMIYDLKRKYGIYYDLHSVETVSVQFDNAVLNNSTLHTIHDANEELYERLWQKYFSSVNIAARKNMKLHIQHMPRRYWKYLIEKHPAA